METPTNMSYSQFVLPHVKEQIQGKKYFCVTRKEREKRMEALEQSCNELETQVKKRRACIEKLNQAQATLQKEIEEQRLLLEEEKKKLAEYQRKNEYYIRIRQDYLDWTRENKTLAEEKEVLKKENGIRTRGKKKWK